MVNAHKEFNENLPGKKKRAWWLVWALWLLVLVAFVLLVFQLRTSDHFLNMYASIAFMLVFILGPNFLVSYVRKKYGNKNRQR
jgi:amino acid transporter